MRLLTALGVAVFAFVAMAETSGSLNDLKFSGRPVTQVLGDYERAGYELFYSTSLIRPSLTFDREPTAHAPVARLDQALGSIGLALQVDPNGRLRVVRPPPLAQPPDRVTGRVVDAVTGEPLVGVVVELPGVSLITDQTGRFVLTGQQIQQVSFKHAGYVPQVVRQVREVLTVNLTPQLTLEEMVVVSSRYAVQDSTTQSHLLDLQLTNDLPKLGEDPLRITSHLPGMATIGVSAKPHIRGGLQDELLVLFNNVELLEPFHLRDFQSVFSTFNPSLIESIDVYTGGFPARYGDRMSGVMDIDPATAYDHSRGEVSLSLLNFSALVHGKHAEGCGEWLASARRGNLDIVTKQINSTVGKPAYSDAFAQYRHELSPDTELDMGVIAYTDDIELSDFDTDGEIAESSYRNLYGWAQLHRSWTPRLEGSSVFYGGRINHHRQGFLSDEDLDNGLAFVDDRRDFQLWSLGQLLRFKADPTLHLELGARLTHQRGRYRYMANIERGVLAEILGNELIRQSNQQLDPRGWSGGAFVSTRWQPLEQLSVEAGLRWDFQDYSLGSSDSQLSPRISVRWAFNDYTEVRWSVGRFFQPEGIHELQIDDGLTRYEQAQHADHYILGVHHQFGASPWSLRTEVFSKRFSNPKRRFENLFNPLVLLPELASDRVEIAPRSARAQGVETTIKYQPDTRRMAWLTYSHARVEDRLAAGDTPRAWDQGATVSAGMNYTHNRWQIGATLLWHDGWRTTRLPEFVAEDAVVTVQRNRQRLKDYFSLDLRVSHTWTWPAQSISAFLEVTNVVSRRNVGGIEYDVEESEDEPGYELATGEENLLPLVPSIGVRWQF